MNRKFTKRSGGTGRSLTFSTSLLQSVGMDIENVEVTLSEGEIRIKAVKPVGGITFPIQIAERLCEDWNELQWMCGQMAGRQLAAQMASLEVDASGNGGDEPAAWGAAVDNSTLF